MMTYYLTSARGEYVYAGTMAECLLCADAMYAQGWAGYLVTNAGLRVFRWGC